MASTYRSCLFHSLQRRQCACTEFGGLLHVRCTHLISTRDFSDSNVVPDHYYIKRMLTQADFECLLLSKARVSL